MHHLEIVDLYNRGLVNFDALPAFEKDVFVVHTLNLWYEMEGTLEDFVLGETYSDQLKWLGETLQRIGDHGSSTIFSSLTALSWAQRDTVAELSEQLYDLMEPRSRLLEQYLHTQGVAVAW